MSTADSPPRPKHRRRLLFLLGAGVLLIAGVLGYRAFWLTRTVGTGPAGPAVPRQAFESVWSERPVVLVGLGDSITAGFGARRGYGYFDGLVVSPEQEQADVRDLNLTCVLPNLTSLNLAISGSNSIECLEIELPRLEQQSSDVFGIVVITTGGNDVIHNYGRTPPREGAMYGATYAQADPWIINYRDRLRRIVNELEARFPGGCAIFLANIYDPTDGVGDAFNAGLPRWPDAMRVLAAYNSVIANVASDVESVHLVDIRTPFLGHGIHCRQFWRADYHAEDPHYWYFANLEDPNERGYDAIRRLFLNEMLKVLPDALQ